MADRAVAPASPRTHLRVRRNMRWLAAGVLAVALGGLGTGFVFTSIADTRPAIKLTRTIYRGQAIQASDLTVVPIGRSVDVAVVPGDRLNEIVGRNARTDLVSGSLLVDGSVGGPDLAAGQARVGLKVEVGRIPSTPMQPGTLVKVVAVPAANAVAGASPLPVSVEATLAATPTTAADGSIVIDLNVPLASAEQVARLGALKQVAIIRASEA